MCVYIMFIHISCTHTFYIHILLYITCALKLMACLKYQALKNFNFHLIFFYDIYIYNYKVVNLLISVIAYLLSEIICDLFMLF